MSAAKYVLCVERDSFDPETTDSRPIVFEQYLDQGAAEYENVKAHAERLCGMYGETKIARLVFEGEEGFKA